jgi:hypothetical protein
MAPSGTSSGLRIYGTKPYESDGGFSINGLLLTTAIGVAVAVAMGIVAGMVGQFFYAVIIFPLGIGLAVGAAQMWTIKHTKIRTPLACGAAGLVAGVVAVITMHYFNYCFFQHGMAEAVLEEKALLAAIATAPDEEERQYLRAALAEYEADPSVQQARQVDSFTSYVDWSARQGVEISPMHSELVDDSRKGMNLGYAGTYVYWVAEAVIVALIAAAVARRRAAAPFCSRCDSWMAERELGALNAAPKVVGELIQSGRLVDLPTVPAHSGFEVAISACECATCGQTEDVVLQVDQVTYANGARSKHPKARAIYPREAATVVERFFTDAAATAAQQTGELALSAPTR